MKTFIDIFFLIAAFVGMEGVAWLAHKYIMHGWLWSLHKDHHRKESEGFLEHNDFFFFLFASGGGVVPRLRAPRWWSLQTIP